MANTPAATVIGCEAGIIVTAEAGFYEVWNGDTCLGYIKGPGEKSFPLKMGRHEIVVYCAGRIVLRKTVTVGAEPEPEPETQSEPEEAPQERGLTLDRLIGLKAMLECLLQEVDQAIAELKGE